MKSRPFSQVIVANDIQGLGEGGVVQKILEYDLIHCFLESDNTSFFEEFISFTNCETNK